VELAGGELRHRQFAKSLLPCLENPDLPIREESLCELAGEIMVRNARWKMAVNTQAQAYLLFDLENDPRETRNLAGLSDYREVESTLFLRMRERVREAQMR